MVARARPHRSATAKVLAHPGAFALSVLKAFRANQGLLLAGAVAYYTLLSLVPFLILAMIVLSHAIDAERLLVVLREYLGFVVPGRSDALVDELRTFLEHRHVIGGVLIVTLVFFSALAFTVLENAMSVIFFHRVAITPPALPRLGAHPVFFHRVARDRLSRRHPRLRCAALAWHSQHRGARAVPVARGRIDNAALCYRRRGGDPHADVDLPGDAGRAGCRCGTRWSAASPPACCGRPPGTSSSGTTRRCRKSRWSTARSPRRSWCC